MEALTISDFCCCSLSKKIPKKIYIEEKKLENVTSISTFGKHCWKFFLVLDYFWNSSPFYKPLSN